ncbi:ATP-dependent DNA helicase [Trichonephila clavipes]|uniref:ATP-dependent DNA helicase n=1 Tax=Trichonephila clavipes TaxID=2585209 RepID=A0A8X6VZQ4_TRICX|nr:ATP-dependent DNA helicase [Trichonephila clavipes]
MRCSTSAEVASSSLEKYKDPRNTYNSTLLDCLQETTGTREQRERIQACALGCNLPLCTVESYQNLFYIILIGDLRHLPPVRSTPIYKQPKQTLVGPILWQNLNFYEINEVLHQANQQFSSILAKIGNGEQLHEMEIVLIESRFFCRVEEAEARNYFSIQSPALSKKLWDGLSRSSNYTSSSNCCPFQISFIFSKRLSSYGDKWRPQGECSAYSEHVQVFES